MYKYRAEAEEKAAQIQLALQTEQERSDSTAMAPTVFGQASLSKEHLTPAHKVNLISVKSLNSLVKLCSCDMKKFFGVFFFLNCFSSSFFS